MTELLKYKNILFDDWEEDNNGMWARMCPKCLEKYSDRMDLEIDSSGSGCCSVYGCKETGENMEVDVKYIDFDINAVEFIEK